MKWIITLSIVAVCAVSALVVIAADEPKGKEEMKPVEMTVKGEVVDLYCWMSAGARGEGHKACAIACAKAGQPIGLVDEKGMGYLLPGKDKTKAYEGISDKMAVMVTVKGMMYDRGGLKAIVVSEIAAEK